MHLISASYMIYFSYFSYGPLRPLSAGAFVRPHRAVCRSTRLPKFGASLRCSDPNEPLVAELSLDKQRSNCSPFFLSRDLLICGCLPSSSDAHQLPTGAFVCPCLLAHCGLAGRFVSRLIALSTSFNGSPCDTRLE